MAQSSEATKLSSHNVDNKNSTLVNTVLTYLTLVGVGAIVGYVIFFSIYNHRCSDMMDDAERNFNQTKEGLSHKLIEAIHKNTANEVAESEVLELRGRLAGQADLLGKYQALLDNHQTTVERLNGLQTKVTELQSCPMRINDLENTLNVASVQKDSLEKRLQQANEKVEQLQEQSKNSVVAAACEAQQQKSMTHIQKLHQALCKEKYVVERSCNFFFFFLVENQC